jgi:hypothetical protein
MLRIRLLQESKREKENFKLKIKQDIKEQKMCFSEPTKMKRPKLQDKNNQFSIKLVSQFFI